MRSNHKKNVSSKNCKAVALARTNGRRVKRKSESTNYNQIFQELIPHIITES